MGLNEVVQENSRINLEEIKAGKIYLQSKPIFFNIDLTGRCNINPPCVFCSLKSSGYHYDALEISYIDKHWNFFGASERVTDCSFGEPLTHPDFMKLVHRLAAGGQAFTFATNGLLLTRKKADLLVEAGENIGFSVSINAAKDSTYNNLTGQSFIKVIENISYYINRYKQIYGHTPPIALSFIVMKVNRNEVLDFLRLAHSMEITLINLRHLFEFDHSLPRNDFGYEFIYKNEILSNDEYDLIKNKAKTLAKELGITLVVHWDILASEIQRLSEPGVDIPCLFPWKFLFLQEHTRDVSMCCYSNQPVGNIKGNRIEDVWNGETLAQIRRDLVNRKIPDFCMKHGPSCSLGDKREKRYK